MLAVCCLALQIEYPHVLTFLRTFPVGFVLAPDTALLAGVKSLESRKVRLGLY